MRFTCQAGQLRDAVTFAARAIGNRPVTPVLHGLLVDVGDTGEVTVTGFDLETAMAAIVVAEASEPGRALLPSRLVVDFLRGLPPRESLSFDVDGETAHVGCGRSRARFRLMLATEYPALPVMPPAVGRIPADLLAHAVAGTLPAVDRDGRVGVPVLTGIMLTAAGGTLTVAGTDRYRLAVQDVPWNGEDMTLTVPAQPLDFAARSFAGSQTDVEITVGKGTFGLAGPYRRVSTRAIDGEQPRWRPLLPTDPTTTVTFDSEEMADAVTRMAIFLETPTAAIGLAITEDGITVTPAASDKGSGDVEVDGELVGEPLTVNVRPSFLLDALKRVPGQVTARLTTATKPMMLTGSDEGYLHLVMPVKVPK